MFCRQVALIAGALLGDFNESDQVLPIAVVDIDQLLFLISLIISQSLVSSISSKWLVNGS